MANKKSGTISIQIAVTPDAKAVVDALMRKTKIPQIQILSSIYQWFAQLPDHAQKAILWPHDSAEEIDATVVALDYLARVRGTKTSGSGAEPNLLEQWQALLAQHRPGTQAGKALSSSKKQPPPQSQAG